MKANSRNIKCSKCETIVKEYSGPVKPPLCEDCRSGKRKRKPVEAEAVDTALSTQSPDTGGG